MRRIRLVAGLGTLVFALACACGKGAECEEDERDDYGTCVPVECGEYPFGGFAGGDFVFVNASGYSEDDDQDGSEEEPYDTLGEGIAKALTRNPVAAVIVASGDYPGSIALDGRHHGLQIEGVCGPSVRITGGEQPGLLLEGSAETVVEVANVHFWSGEGPAAVVIGGRLVLTNVDATAPVAVGFAAFGREAFLDITDAVLTDVVAREELDGYGLAVAEGATATATGLTVRASGLAAVLVDGAGSSAVLTGSLLEGTPLGSVGAQPAGMAVTNGARATVIDTRIVESWDVGLEVSGGSSATVELVEVSAVHAGVQAFGSGVVVLEGSALVAADLAVDGASLYGVAASGEGTTVDLVGGSIERSVPSAAEPTAGIGLIASDGAVVNAANVRIAENHVYGAVVSDPGSELALVDVDLLDTAPTGLSTLGGGILVQEGGALTAERVSVVGSRTIGILVDASTAALTDVDVRDTRRGSSQSTAVGIAVQSDAAFEGADVEVTDTEGPGLLVSYATATCVGCTLSRNAFAALLAADGAEVVVSDAILDQTTPDATEGGGVGVFVESGNLPVTLTLSTSEVGANAHAAVYVNGGGDVLLDGNTLVGGAAIRTVWPRGTALYAAGTSAASLALTGNTVSASQGAGLFFDGGTATLSANVYSGNTIDVVQQLCGSGVAPPEGLEDEPVDVVELCPTYDYPVERFRFLTVYEPLVLGD